MTSISRKEFLKTSAILFAALAGGNAINFRKKDPLLSFSTLGCPDWTWEQIINFAVQHGYKGIEVRGLQRELDLTKAPQFNTERSRNTTVAQMKAKGLSFVGLGSSANLHFKKSVEREKNLDEARRFIDLAQQINCPYVRVFPNNFLKEQSKEETIDLIVKGLLELGDYAKERNVTVLMETHGDVVKINDLFNIMQASEHSHVGLLWDISNMWTVTKESPTEAWNTLKKYIRHTHIKDAKILNDKLSYTFLGEGDVPIFEALKQLAKGGYKGYYSFEWEKLWHRDLAEPEIAFAHYSKKMKTILKDCRL